MPLSQTKRAKALRKMRREESPEAKASRLSHRRALMARWRAWRKRIDEREALCLSKNRKNKS